MAIWIWNRRNRMNDLRWIFAWMRKRKSELNVHHSIYWGLRSEGEVSDTDTENTTNMRTEELKIIMLIFRCLLFVGFCLCFDICIIFGYDSSAFVFCLALAICFLALFGSLAFQLNYKNNKFANFYTTLLYLYPYLMLLLLMTMMKMTMTGFLLRLAGNCGRFALGWSRSFCCFLVF